jgi:hypothetical protein
MTSYKVVEFVGFVMFKLSIDMYHKCPLVTDT